MSALPGCLQLRYARETRFEPVPAQAVGALRPGESTLGEALAGLGAPLWVWEHGGDGLAAAWGWYHARSWRLRASVAVERFTSASLTYDDVAEDMHGYVLFFDQGWRLEGIHAGRLRDLTREVRRRRPAPVGGREQEERP